MKSLTFLTRRFQPFGTRLPNVRSPKEAIRFFLFDEIVVRRRKLQSDQTSVQIDAPGLEDVEKVFLIGTICHGTSEVEHPLKYR